MTCSAAALQWPRVFLRVGIFDNSCFDTYFGNGVADFSKSIGKHTARCADVQARETFALTTEHGTVVEGYVGMVEQQAHKLLLAQTKAAEVDPQQERGLRLYDSYSGHLAGQEVAGKVDIGLHVFKHLVEPLLAVAVGGFGTDGRNHGGCAEFVHFQPVVEALAEFGILYNHPRAYKTGDVEGLGGGT